MKANTLIFGIFAATLGVTAFAKEVASTDSERSKENKWYLGAGLGFSRLSPDTTQTNYGVDDKSSEGAKLLLGYRLSEKVSVEGYYANLGEAGISPTGEIEYEDAGVYANYRWYPKERKEAGLSLLGRVGLGYMMNSTALPYERENDAHLMLGLGAEYLFKRGWALRSDLDLFDEDAQLFSVSLIKYFGSKRKTRSSVVLPPEQSGLPSQEVPVEPQPQPLNADIDGDSVLNENDRCADTPKGTLVDTSGCALPEIIVLEGVNFETNSAELRPDSVDTLESAVSMFMRYTDLHAEVAGHTDSDGSTAFNQSLSERRAESVRQYLIARGVSSSVLRAVGYGESKPIADNQTERGREKNRRVELHINLDKQTPSIER